VDDDKDGVHVTKMQQRGALDFFFPKVDMPLNVVLVSVYVPTGYRYGEFTVQTDCDCLEPSINLDKGDVKEVQRFSTPVPTSEPAGGASQISKPRAQVQLQRYDSADVCRFSSLYDVCNILISINSIKLKATSNRSSSRCSKESWNFKRR
jgi:hypothetical protein